MTPISPGTLLAGRFRLEDLLEETGGARFWRATDLTLMRDVAVHVVDANDARAQALMAAARASATVTGPHLLRVLDAAVEDGVAYVVNEWGNGVSLDRMLLEGPLAPRQAAWMVREVAEAIADAHRTGMAHGRLMPETVMINENGSVKLIGFAVDSVLHGPPDHGLSEQESDVRNLAALLYAALVGRWPGTPGTTLAEAPREHGRVLRARQVRAGVPRPLDRICDTVLNSSDPTFPIQTAHEIRAALADFLGELDEGMPLGRRTADDPEPTVQVARPDLDPEATQTAIPLFADDPTAAHPVPRSSKTPYVGMGGGRAPDAWGPDAVREPVVQPAEWAGEWEGDPPGTPWLRLAGLVAAILLLVVVVVFAFNLGRGDGSDPDGTEEPSGRSPSATELRIVRVDDFDPGADPPEESPDSVALAHDGDPSTAWTTSTYEDGPEIIIKQGDQGVGLLVDLGSEKPVSEVALRLEGSPTTVELLAAPSGSGVPATTENLEELAVEAGAGESLTLAPDSPVTTRYLVIWLTSLPTVTDGFRGGIAEIVVRS